MSQKNLQSIITLLTCIFFINAVVEITAEYFFLTTIIYITKPLIPILLMVLYWFSSLQKKGLFFLTLFFSVVTNVLFIPTSERCLFYAIIAFGIHRILMLLFIYKTIKKIYLKQFIIVIIPLLLIFFYLFIESAYVPENSFWILVVQIFLIALFGGIAVSNYIIEDTRESSFLLICGLLFMGLQLVLYVEKYFLHAIPIISLRPIAMTLNVLAFYSFYKFVMVSEETKL